MQEHEWSNLRLQMVDRQIRRRGVRGNRVLEVMETIPRHLFVLPELRMRAYEDSALPIEKGQTISQPYIVAFMTELLEVSPHYRILEVGTGSGYQTMVLAALANRVFSIDIHISLLDKAKQLLAALGVTNVELDLRNGHLGWPEAGPFDGIIVTAGSESIPDPLVRQMVPGARMVIPVGPRDQDQTLKLVLKASDQSITAKDMGAVRFVPLVQ
jgi:protein-L-isoaspartate(D-aspartate) O-methyltransferase